NGFAALDAYLFQLSLRKKTNPQPVRGEKRSVCSLCARQTDSLSLVKPPGPEAWCFVAAMRNKNQPGTISGEHYRPTGRGPERGIRAEIEIQLRTRVLWQARGLSPRRPQREGESQSQCCGYDPGQRAPEPIGRRLGSAFGCGVPSLLQGDARL